MLWLPISCQPSAARAVAPSKGYEPDLASLDLYNRLGGNQRRILEAVGLDRTARELVPTLSSYIRELDAERVG